ncbi:MAG: hypothetical protein WBP12_02470 [Candidatus Saccharimonas sp.]
MELFVAVCLIVIGLAVGLLGLKLFRVLLPVAGLVAGATIGYTGFQGIFGTGVASTTVAVLVAIVFGLVLAVLSYAFFDIALAVLMGAALSSLFTLLGVALGLSANGFVVFLLSVSGFIIGITLALSSGLLTESLVTLVTAFVGTGFILGGVFLLSSGISMNDLATNGIIASVAQRVDTSFWWVLVWIAGAVVMRHIQLRSLFLEIFPENLAYKAKSN